MEEIEAVKDVAEDMLERIHHWDCIGGPFGIMAKRRNRLNKELQQKLEKVVQEWKTEQLEQAERREHGKA